MQKRARRTRLGYYNLTDKTMPGLDWVDEREAERKKEQSDGYFNIQEGKQQFVLLTHAEPLTQVWDNAKKQYRTAVEGDKNVSIKGVCWVLQDGKVKQAKLPYTILKQIRAIQQDPEWDFKFPFAHLLTLTAVGAGTKEVEYTLNPSPKEVEIPQDILDELAKKPSPADIVERIKNGPKVSQRNEEESVPYPTPEDEGIKPDDIPF